MPSATKMPTPSELILYQWSRKGAPFPKLGAPISATATTLTFSAPLKDETDTVVTKAFLLGIRKAKGWTETCLVTSGTLNYDAQTANFTVGEVLTGGTSNATALIVEDTDSGTAGTLNLIITSGTFQDNETITDASGGSATSDGTLTASLSADGLTASNVIRGIDPGGLDYTVGNTLFADTHEKDEPVFCNIPAFIPEVIRGVLQGLVASGGSDFIIGIDVEGTVTISRSSGTGASKGFLRWSSSSSMAEFSNDGTTWTAISDTVASSLYKNSATDTTPGYGGVKNVAGTGIDLTILNPGGNETLEYAVDVTDIIDTAAGITESGNKIQVQLSATPGLEFSGGGLQFKAKAGGGLDTDGDGVFLDDNPVSSITAGEAIDGSTTPKACFISEGVGNADTTVSQEQNDYSSGGDADVYGVNWYSQTFTTGTYQNRITQIDLLLEEFGNPAGNFQLDLYAVDGSSKPTGSSLATKTVTATNVGQTYYRWTDFGLASTLTVTPATEYAIVVQTISGDAANYIGWIHGNGNTYGDGQAWSSTDAGLTWSSFANDFCFRVWSYEVQTAGELYMCDKGEPFRGAFDGFVITNTAAASAATIRMGNKQDSFTGLTASSTYYISTTAGGITVTPGGLKVGKAISTTEIEIDKSGGFVVGDRIASESIARIAGTSDEYHVFYDLGFKPSRIEFHIDLLASTSVAASSRDKVFSGTYYPSVFIGNAVVTNVSATAYASANDEQNSSTITVVDGNADTFTLNAPSLTASGVSILLSTDAATAGSSAQGIIRPIFYR
tara:strand:+ start:11237 stop:13588 length:2352 start_codon:yes stop_codon:yes gene_type:complete